MIKNERVTVDLLESCQSPTAGVAEYLEVYLILTEMQIPGTINTSHQSLSQIIHNIIVRVK